MKIRIISDLHQEFGISNFDFSLADLIVLAGDINLGDKGIDWILTEIKNKPVIYVLGNHEYYGGSYPKTLNKIKSKVINTNIYVLENDCIEIDGICFHGATLWTDFSILGDARFYGIICQEKMNDHRKIRIDPSYSKIKSKDLYQIHSRSRSWLEKSLEMRCLKKNIVVTHHAPSIKSVPTQFFNNPVVSAYASNLENLIEKYQPDLWIHGHIHTPVDYTVGKTRIVCNPHGYLDEPNNGHQKQLIIEV